MTDPIFLGYAAGLVCRRLEEALHQELAPLTKKRSSDFFTVGDCLRDVPEVVYLDEESVATTCNMNDLPAFNRHETLVLNTMLQASAANGDDFGCIEDVVADLHEVMGPERVGGYITVLQRKMPARFEIEIFQPVKTSERVWTQFTVANTEELRLALIQAQKTKTAESVEQDSADPDAEMDIL